MTREEFIEQIAKWVEIYAPKYGVCVYSPIIAQACLECAYGTSELAIYCHNFFGLKYNSEVSNGGKYLKIGSEQNPDGTYVSSVMEWCTFRPESYEAGVKGYFDFLFGRTGVTRYNNLKGITDARTYLETIKADGYATSLSYVDNLMRVIEANGLDKYDPAPTPSKYSQSPLACMTKLSPNCTKMTDKKINYIIPHCYVGHVSVESGLNHFMGNVNASCQYVVGNDGRIGASCLESDRSWCTGGDKVVHNQYGTFTGRDLDYQSITIECANDAFAPYATNDAEYNGLIRLMADIAKRNNMGKLKWKADPNLIGNPEEQNVLVHRWLASKSCPGDFLYQHMADICAKANAINGYGDDPTPTPEPAKTYTVDDFRNDVMKILGVSTTNEAFNLAPTISKVVNSTNELVTPLERYMTAIGYYAGGIEADSGKSPCFGGGMEKAVKAYQRDIVKAPSAYQDGIISAKGNTWKTLLGV